MSSPIYFIKKLFSGVTKYASKSTYLPTSEIIFSFNRTTWPGRKRQYDPV